MSDEKREQLIAEGRLNEDGSRKQRCPCCGTELTPEQYEAAFPQVDEARRDTVAMPAPTVVDTAVPPPKG